VSTSNPDPTIIITIEHSAEIAWPAVLFKLQSSSTSWLHLEPHGEQMESKLQASSPASTCGRMPSRQSTMPATVATADLVLSISLAGRHSETPPGPKLAHAVSRPISASPVIQHPSRTGRRWSCERSVLPLNHSLPRVRVFFARLYGPVFLALLSPVPSISGFPTCFVRILV
jgi:hypothetical protein